MRFGELREGYIAKWKEYPKDEEKVRVARPSHLAPSQALLDLYKRGRLKWFQYVNRYRNEIAHNSVAQKMIWGIIQHLEGGKNVRLICYEKQPPCHRFILMSIIKERQGWLASQIELCPDCKNDPKIACSRNVDGMCLECGVKLCARHMVLHWMREHHISIEWTGLKKRNIIMEKQGKSSSQIGWTGIKNSLG